MGEHSRRPRLRPGAAIVICVALVVLLFGPGGGPASSVVGQGVADYVLGPGDSVVITVFGEADLSRTVTIRPDGKVNLPLIGDVQAAGLTPVQFADRLSLGLKTFLRNPQVSVSISAFRVERNFVYLMGQVTRPGPIEIQKGWTMMEVMAVAGGVTPRAALRRASIIRRSSGQTIGLDLDRLLLRADRSANVTVEPDDLIMVPTLQSRVLILGAVRGPGAYDLEDGARLLDALALAGGPSDRARPSSIGVIRNGPDGKLVVTTLDVTKIFRGDVSQNIPLQHADVIYVPDSPLISFGNILSWLSGLSLIRGLFLGF